MVLTGAAKAQPEHEEALKAATADAYDLSNSFLDVLAGLQQINPAIAPQPPKRRRAQTCAGLWQEMDQWYEAIKPFQDDSLDRWHRKTLAPGGTVSIWAEYQGREDAPEEGMLP